MLLPVDLTPVEGSWIMLVLVLLVALLSPVVFFGLIIYWDAILKKLHLKR